MRVGQNKEDQRNDDVHPPPRLLHAPAEEEQRELPLLQRARRLVQPDGQLRPRVPLRGRLLCYVCMHVRVCVCSSKRGDR